MATPNRVGMKISLSLFSTIKGTNRSRLFADGKPNSPFANVQWTDVRSITPIMNGAGIVSGSPMPTDSGSGDQISDNDYVSVENSHATIINANGKELMPERLSPDGADEGDDLQIITDEQTEFDDDAWSDWETEKQTDGLEQMDEKPATEANCDAYENENRDNATQIVTPNYHRSMSISSSNSTSTNNQNHPDNLIKDIKDIEIKTVIQLDNEIDDFFKDMEPVIEMPNSIASLLKSPQFDINSINKSEPSQSKQIENKTNQNRFAMTVSVEDEEHFDDAAWGDEANDWDN